LASKDREHRSVKKMLLKTGPELAEQARHAHAHGELAVARELIECAERCTPLDAESKGLRERIVQDCEEASKQREWTVGRIRQAVDWARHGRLTSAIAMIRPADDEPEVARLMLDWEEQRERLQRYFSDFRDLLSRGELPDAEEMLGKAQEIGRKHPQVICMEAALQQAIGRPSMPAYGNEDAAENADDRVSAASLPIVDRGMVFALDGLNRSGPVLVVSQPIVTVGANTASWVQVPMQGNLHGSHAVILREEEPKERKTQYRMVPLAGCPVSIRGDDVGDCRTLVDGDLIQFGNEQCQWTFHQSVPDSGTAILWRDLRSPACVGTPDGSEFDVIVLLADRLDIGPGREADETPNHLKEPHLPARMMRFEWGRRGLMAKLRPCEAGGDLFVEAGGRNVDVETDPLQAPCELMLYAELVGADLLDDELPDSARLRIWDPRHVG